MTLPGSLTPHYTSLRSGGGKRSRRTNFTKKEEMTMTTLSYDRKGSAGVDAARRSTGFFAGLKRSIRRQALHRELMRLDDRLLADIGLTRTDIAAVAHRAAEE